MLAPGLHRGIPARDYLALQAIGSTSLSWLAVSPLHFKYMSEQPHEETPALSLGTALHMAVLEPERFAQTYVLEPDPISVAPGMAKPRATKAYKDAVANLEATGRQVLRAETFDHVRGMAASIEHHAHAAKILARLPERELTLVWERNGRLCRGRADALGDGAVADLKTTRSLKDFSPWTVTKYAYHVQAGHYGDGVQILGRAVKHRFFIVVESSAPYDVGVFALDDPAYACGQSECERLFKLLDECERTKRWPGMFPDVQTATVTDAAISSSSDEEAA